MEMGVKLDGGGRGTVSFDPLLQKAELLLDPYVKQQWLDQPYTSPIEFPCLLWCRACRGPWLVQITLDKQGEWAVPSAPLLDIQRSL